MTNPNLETILEALSFIPADERERWYRMGMGIHKELGAAGYGIFDAWSQTSANYNSATTKTTYQSFKDAPSKGGKPIGIATIIYEAKSRGYKPNGDSKPHVPSPEEVAERARQEEAARAEEAARRERAANLAAEVWRKAVPVGNEHPYLVRKQIAPTPTLRECSIEQIESILGYRPHGKNRMLQGRCLVAPIMVDGGIVNVELIDETGEKSCIAGGRKSSGFWASGALPEGDGTDQTLGIGEGVATVLSGAQSLDYIGVATFCNSNLPHVAHEMRRRYPKAVLVFLADLEKATGEPDRFAVQAAREAGGILAVSDFGPNRDPNHKDWNDLLVLRGPQEVRRQLEEAIKKAATFNCDTTPNEINDLNERSGLKNNAIRKPINELSENDAKFLFEKKSSESSESSGIARKSSGKSSDAGSKSSASPPQKEGRQRAANDPSRIGQNEMADKIKGYLSNNLAFDVVANRWVARSESGIWQPLSEPLARYKIESGVRRVRPGFSAGYLSGVAKFLEPRLAIDAWESQRHLLPMKNGVLDLQTHELKPYGEFRFNWQIPYAHNKAATCKTILNWLDVITQGDAEFRRFLLAHLRSVLVGGAHLQKFVEVYGPGGTGKSTYIRLCRALVGDQNAIATDLKTLEASRFESASLYGRRLAIVSDSARFGGEISVLKAITGGDPLRYECKNIQAGQPFVFGGLVIIAANEPIQSSDYTSGLARRRIPLFFNRRVTDEERLRDPNFEDQLLSEVPGLLNELLAMSQGEMDQIIRNPGESIARSKLEAELETNPILGWANDELETCTPGEETPIGLADEDGLYGNYVVWCQSHHREPVSLTRFSRLVEDNCTARGIQTAKTRESSKSRKSIMKGLRLRGGDAPGFLFDAKAVVRHQRDREQMEGVL